MSQEHLLVLEESAMLREQTCRLLGEAGYVVEAAASGAEGLAALRRTCFDLLLCDIHLSDMNGIEAFRQMRLADPGLAGVVMTGYSNLQLAMDAVRAGFTGFLVKPFAAEELISAIAATLEQEKLRRENVRLRALVPLYELSRTFMGTSELSQVLDQIVTTARAETRAEVVSLMLLDQDGQSLSIAAASGLSAEVVESQKMALGNGIAGWVAAHGEPLMIAEGMPLNEEVRSAMGKPEVLSALSLPLRTRGEIIGVLNLSRLQGGEPFTPVDMELASVLASQAAIAIDKARLIEDLRSLSETSQRLASALDLDAAASIIVEATAHVAHARRAALWLVEEVMDNLALFKPFNFKQEELRRLQQPALSLLETPEQFALREEGGVLWLPILRGEKKFGLIELHLPGQVPPRPDRLGILRTLANTAAAVIESHRLRAREVIAFREMTDTLRAELNLQQAMERVLIQMVEACDAKGGSIFLLSEDHARLDLLASSGIPAPAPMAQQIVRENQPVLQTRFSDPAFKGIRSLIGAPLIIGSHVEGAVVLNHRTAGAFAPHHLNLLVVLSNSAALIVRNAQLYARSEEAVITEERTRIAREIHDGVAQDLSFLMLKVEIMHKLLERGEYDQLENEFEEMRSALRNDVREVRRTIFALRPLDLETLGFMPALEKFIKDFGSANETRVHFKSTGDGINLSPKLQTALFRLTQESLNNIRKHAHASKVWVEIELTSKWATLQVRDDGQGFDPTLALNDARKRGSVGMVQMRERAERAGGSFQLDTLPGKGTTIKVKLPVK